MTKNVLGGMFFGANIVLGIFLLMGAATNSSVTKEDVKTETNNTYKTNSDNPFIGEIIMFGGNFAPRGWALCDGQLLPISQYSALFSILGTTYGGDGRTTFGLPDLRGRVAMHPGNGPGLTPRNLGTKSGSETNTLTVAQLPSHSHTIVSGGKANNPSPAGNLPANGGTNAYSDGSPGKAMKNSMVNNTGGSQSVNNMQPYQCVNYIIALQGTYPSRS